MRKKIFQICTLMIVLCVMVLFANVQPAIARAESEWEAILAAQELMGRKRAAEAWNELKTTAPELHMGCGSTITDVIGMGRELSEDFGFVERALKEQTVTLDVGTLYKAQERPLICVDAGHLGYTIEGYKNTGAQSVSGEIEHTWSIKVARALRDELLDRGYEVYMVRDTDEWGEYPYTLGERTIFANTMDCEVMVSIHWDGLSDQAVDGYHTIYKGNRQSTNYRLAKAVSDAYGEAVDGAISKYCNPMSRDDLWQLNWAEMPTVIVECGFSSNPSDSAWLEEEENHSVIAQGIANGIDDYFSGEKNSK